MPVLVLILLISDLSADYHSARTGIRLFSPVSVFVVKSKMIITLLTIEIILENVFRLIGTNDFEH